MTDTVPNVVGEVGYALRMPPELKAELEEWAKREHRSLNSLIVVLLEQAARAERRRRT
jgi:hypothetical protein